MTLFNYLPKYPYACDANTLIAITCHLTNS